MDSPLTLEVVLDLDMRAVRIPRRDDSGEVFIPKVYPKNFA